MVIMSRKEKWYDQLSFFLPKINEETSFFFPLPRAKYTFQ